MSRENDVELSYTQDRELSWLKFNARILEEAQDPTVPLFERLKFIAIFTRNLDEFFMVRVGRLEALSLLKQPPADDARGASPRQRLGRIFQAVAQLCRKRDRVLSALEEELQGHGIVRLTPQELTGRERRQAEQWFQDCVAPLLSPLVVNSHHPFPHLPNKQLFLALSLRREGENYLGLVPIPKALPPFLCLDGIHRRYVLSEQIILAHAQSIFSHYTVTSQAVITVTRSADLSFEDEDGEIEEDFRQRVKRILKKRPRLCPVRLEIWGNLNKTTLARLQACLDLEEGQTFRMKGPLSLGYAYLLEKILFPQRPDLFYPPFSPRWPQALSPRKKLIPQLLCRDLLLCYPYHSMAPFLLLIREAASDPAVLSIKITIYRLCAQGKLMEYLAAAAENGKEVTVLLELRARFDEQNNIHWAERLEEAGCTLLYGLEHYKVHAKICLITRREHGKLQTITQLGTGNYNEKTVRLYSDLCLFTADSTIGADAAAFFQDLATGGSGRCCQRLLPAPACLRSSFLTLIDREIAKGDRGFLFFKCNSLTDRVVIDKLVQASGAGVHILMNIRGITCLRPGIPGLTDHIQIFSVVGRFLEHARIYIFGKENDAQIYLSSADLMTRNTQHRVELACPVLAPDLRRQIAHYVEILCHDNKKSRYLQADGSWIQLPPRQDGSSVDAQAVFLNELR